MLNGPTSQQWRTHIRQPVIGCNFAYRDWPIHTLVAVDRMTVRAIRQDIGDQPPWPCWTKLSSLDLPPGWQHRSAPGIDSGSMAMSIALDLAQKIIVIGADTVTGTSTETVYSNLYTWHARNPRRRIHQRHRRTIIDLVRQNPGRFLFVTDEACEDIETVGFEQALELGL